jgi:hypothetical protein
MSLSAERTPHARDTKSRLRRRAVNWRVPVRPGRSRGSPRRRPQPTYAGEVWTAYYPRAIRGARARHRSMDVISAQEVEAGDKGRDRRPSPGRRQCLAGGGGTTPGRCRRPCHPSPVSWSCAPTVHARARCSAVRQARRRRDVGEVSKGKEHVTRPRARSRAGGPCGPRRCTRAAIGSCARRVTCPPATFTPGFRPGSPQEPVGEGRLPARQP